MSDAGVLRRLSVIIPNYNYAQFVGAAIDSALALEWPEVEVVVVDDGSTDDSLAVIGGYGERIRVLATENATQRVAVNRGFAASTGDVVIVLDSDDLLPPDLPAALAAAWGPGVSKVQFRMQRIDGAGRSIGEPFPRFDRIPTPQQLRHWMVRTSAYPTPPGSGNAYARWFLDVVLPADESLGDASDSALLAAAPLLGDVITVPEVVVGYRQHGGNDSDLLVDPRRFPREVQRARARWNYANRAAGAVTVDERALTRSRELLQLRVAALRLASEEPTLVGDGKLRLALGALMSPLHPGPESRRVRVLILAWSMVTLFAPDRLARRLIDRRYRRPAPNAA